MRIGASGSDVHSYGLGLGQTSNQRWMSGWDTIEPFCAAGDSYLFEYKGHGRETAIDRVLTDSIGNPTGTKQWTIGWAAIHRFSVAGKKLSVQLHGERSGYGDR